MKYLVYTTKKVNTEFGILLYFAQWISSGITQDTLVWVLLLKCHSGKASVLCFFFVSFPPASVNFPFGFPVGTFCFVCSKSPDVSPDTWDQLCHGAGLWICRKLGAACILSFSAVGLS